MRHACACLRAMDEPGPGGGCEGERQTSFFEGERVMGRGQTGQQQWRRKGKADPGKACAAAAARVRVIPAAGPVANRRPHHQTIKQTRLGSQAGLRVRALKQGSRLCSASSKLLAFLEARLLAACMSCCARLLRPGRAGAAPLAKLLPTHFPFARACSPPRRPGRAGLDKTLGALPGVPTSA